MLSSEFGDGRDLLHHVVTEEYDVRHVRHKGASVTGVDGDRSRRVDEVSGNLNVVARWFLQIYGRNNSVMQGCVLRSVPQFEVGVLAYTVYTTYSSFRKLKTRI